MKRSTDDFGRFNETAPGFLTGGTGFGILGEDRPEIMPADRPPLSSGGTIRFPTATEGHNSRFPSFGSFGGDSIDRLPNKNQPPIRIPPSNKSLIYFRYCRSIVFNVGNFSFENFSKQMSFRSTALSKSDRIRSGHVTIHELATSIRGCHRTDGRAD